MNFARSLLIGIVLVFSGAVAQQPKDQQEPQYIGVPVAISESGLTSLEEQANVITSQTKMKGLGGINGGMFFEGEKSPVRFPAGAPLSFIVRVRDQDLHVDPNTIINLNRLGVGKGKRGIVLAKVGALGLGMGETKHPPLALRCHQIRSNFCSVRD